MRLQREVAGIEEAHYRAGHVALECLGVCGQKEQTVLPPDSRSTDAPITHVRLNRKRIKSRVDVVTFIGIL